MKKAFSVLALSTCFTLANADNIPSGHYVGNLSEATSSWTWDTAVEGDIDDNSYLTLHIPGNPHLFNLKGTLNATVNLDGNACSSPDAVVHVGVISAKVTFSNCFFDGNTIKTDYVTNPIFGFTIHGSAVVEKK